MYSPKQEDEGKGCYPNVGVTITLSFETLDFVLS